MTLDRRIGIPALAVGLSFFPDAAEAAGPKLEGMVLVRAGPYRPLYKQRNGRQTAWVAAFLLDSLPASRAAFATFVTRDPRWSKTGILPLFAENTYLSDWGPDAPPAAPGPVTFVSWFAAKAYCEDAGKRLPTVAEWERAFQNARSRDRSGFGSGPEAEPTLYRVAMGSSLARSGDPAFGEVWEWTLDFNSTWVSGRTGTSGPVVSSLFCGEGARAINPRDYAVFLRYAFRSGLRADYALKNLGFRCARDWP